MSKKELAAQYHASGCNCAMAVGCAFCDKAGVSEEEILEKIGGVQRHVRFLIAAGGESEETDEQERSGQNERNNLFHGK